jgi:hypothetical protein
MEIFMTTMTKTIGQTIETFLAQLKNVNPAAKLRLLAAVADLLRHSHGITGNAHAVPIANLIAAGRAFPWDKLDFFLTAELLSPSGVWAQTAKQLNLPDDACAEILLQAITLFFESVESGILESAPDVTQVDLLRATIESVASQVVPVKKVVPYSAPAEIYTHKLLARVYVPQPVTPEMFHDFDLQYGLCTAPVGHQIRAVCCTCPSGDKFFIMESGEVVLQADTAHFVPYTKAEDFLRIPSFLLVSLQLALSTTEFYRQLLPAPFVAAFGGSDAAWFSGPFGKFVHPVRSVVVGAQEVQSLVDGTLDVAEKGASLEHTRQFAVGIDTMSFTHDLAVVIAARKQDTGLCSVVSALVQDIPAGGVIMRHDYPRQHISGFYLFPLKTGLINLTIKL